MSGYQNEGLYFMNDSPPTVMNVNNVTTPTSKSINELHVMFGHSSREDILRLAEYYEFDIIDKKEEVSCDSCVRSTIRRSNFKKIPILSNLKPGDEIHSDLVGKIVPPSLGGKSYFVLYIDKESDYYFGKTMKHKSECDEGFRQIIAHLRTQLDIRAKRLVSDGEGSYVSNSFQDFLKKKGIIHKRTPSFTPQRDGKAERSNLSVLNRTRTLIIHKNLPRELWGEAFNYVLYVLNRLVKRGETMSRYEKSNTSMSSDVMLSIKIIIIFKN